MLCGVGEERKSVLFGVLGARHTQEMLAISQQSEGNRRGPHIHCVEVPISLWTLTIPWIFSEPRTPTANSEDVGKLYGNCSRNFKDICGDFEETSGFCSTSVE